MLRDWRGVDPAVVGGLYERERRHWRDVLAWDTAWTWATLERARTAHRLPGTIAFDAANRAAGWTFYIAEHGTLHLGGLVSESAATTAELLAAALAAASARDAVSCFILDRAAGLEAALTERGFGVERFHYLSLNLADVDAGATSADVESAPWRDDDIAAAASLLSGAYAGDAGVHFAPTGDWRSYVSGLVTQAGCGVFDPRASRCIRGATGIDALVMMTTLSPATAHVAQIAVHADRRGRGLASRLLRRTAIAARAAGMATLTLNVGARNAAARRLYDAMGFSERATFVAARREAAHAARCGVAS